VAKKAQKWIPEVGCKGEPLCGWGWIHTHLHDEYPEPVMELLYDGEVMATVTGQDKPGCVRAALNGFKEGKSDQDV